MRLILAAQRLYWALVAWSRQIDYHNATTISRRSRRDLLAAQEECERAAALSENRKRALREARDRIASIDEARGKLEVRSRFGAL